MTDTHAHINVPRFAEDLSAVVERAVSAGVSTIIVVGVDIPTSRAAVAIAKRFPSCWATIGIHPHEADACSPETWRELETLAKAPRVVAIGETGLDYYRNYASKDAQARAFAKQLALAAKANLPVVVHMREAYADVHRALKQAMPPRQAVMHCFSGDYAQAAALIDLGCMISLAGPVTFRSAVKLHHVAKMVPSDRLLLETDCPYLAPVPHRGKRNEPAYVRFTLEAVAQRRNVAAKELEEITDRNAQTFFGITPLRTAV
ncbi:MAG: TatD family hydrolase [Chloroflexota bacterium]|nr:TatD family hydrolase [Chloroflexota bacterium]MDE2930096.1 TatD family hydrolase [Chloroflexota bacterium]